MISLFFFFNDTATTEIYTLSLHDALPIYVLVDHQDRLAGRLQRGEASPDLLAHQRREPLGRLVEDRSEEHTSELQSRSDLVCRLLLEKKKSEFGQHLNYRFTIHAIGCHYE